jgi:hypothetical protein
MVKTYKGSKYKSKEQLWDKIIILIWEFNLLATDFLFQILAHPVFKL